MPVTLDSYMMDIETHLNVIDNDFGSVSKLLG